MSREEAPVTQYGVRFPNGNTIWAEPKGENREQVIWEFPGANIANQVGRAEAREQYRYKLLGVQLEPDDATSLTFVTRTITTTYSESVEVIDK